LKGTNECLDAAPGDSNVWLRPCEEKITESWKLEEAMPVPKAGMDNVMMSLLALASVGALSMGAWLWKRHGKMPALTSRIAATTTRHGDVLMVGPFTPEKIYSMSAEERAAAVKEVKEKQGSRSRGKGPSEGTMNVEFTEEAFADAVSRAIPFKGPEEELAAVLAEATKVEEVEAAIKKCLEDGGRDGSDVIKNAQKQVKSAEGGKVTPVKPKAKAKGKAKAFAWGRKIKKRHDNSR